MRRDFLKELQSLAIVGCFFIAIGIAVGLAQLVTDDTVVTRMLIKLETLPAGAIADSPAEVDIAIAAPTVQQRVLSGLTQAPTKVLLLAALIVLVVVLNRARRDGPFTRQTVNGLRWIGVMLWAGIIAAVIEGWAQLALTDTITPGTWVYEVNLPFGWLFGGFVCFAVAEMVSRGMKLSNELATVI